MNRTLTAFLAVAALFVAMILYWFVQSSYSARSTNTQASIASSPATEKLAAAPPQVAIQTESDVETPAEKEEPCLTLREVDLRSIVTNNESRMDRVRVDSPIINSYRNLPASDLKRLAIQGDSAAMVVLGAVSVMRSRKWPEDKAVSYLLGDDPNYASFKLQRPYSQEFIDHLNEARQWYYKAALHGRLMAFTRVGLVSATLGETPVDLGWIGEQEYAAMSPKERKALRPVHLYTALPYEIAPELRQGLMSSMINQMIPQRAEHQEILMTLKAEFEHELQRENLPAISVATSNAPPLEEIVSRLCKGIDASK